jgi:hypothetical protein
MTTIATTTDTSQKSNHAVQILLQNGCCDFINHRGCFGLAKSSKRMIHLIEDIEGLSQFQKNGLISRYISIVENIRYRSKYYAWFFHVGRTVITVGSLIVPALLSIQYSDAKPDGIASLPLVIYWITWFVSLFVTTFNGILNLFKIDKKYYFLHATLEQLKSEIWHYIHLSGKYGGYYTKGDTPTHVNQFVFICHNLEKIKLRQVQEEYFKWIDSPQTNTQQEKGAGSGGGATVGAGTGLGGVVDDSTTEGTRSSNTTTIQDKMIAGLYTPTPDSVQLLTHQQELANALKPGPKVDGNSTTQPPQTKGRKNGATTSVALSMR